MKLYILFGLIYLSTFITTIYSGCCNHCSGHGICSIDDTCECYPGWRMGDAEGGDCSDRECPAGVAWVDEPDVDGEFHKYAECSNKGECNRVTGECECFPGYEGKACDRHECPNSCSGHGRCTYIEDLTYGEVFGDYYDGSSSALSGIGTTAKTFEDTYFHFDKTKSRACVCDAGYTGLDCSRRMCPRGNDVTDERDNTEDTLKYQVQRIQLHAAGPLGNSTGGLISSLDGSTFALTFVSRTNEKYTTIPIKFDSANPTDFADDIELALKGLPNRVIDDLSVTVDVKANNTINIDAEFTGTHVQGQQNLLMVEADQCGNGCTPKITGLDLASHTSRLSYVQEFKTADYQNLECGNRGSCDYETGICSCFVGYTGEACNVQTALV